MKTIGDLSSAEIASLLQLSLDNKYVNFEKFFPEEKKRYFLDLEVKNYTSLIVYNQITVSFQLG